jgi:transcriptional regulator with XRE-family HTH domain
MPSSDDLALNPWATDPVTAEDKARIGLDLEADRKLARAVERVERRDMQRRRKELRRQRQEDMGVGYLIYVARKHSRLSQGRLARRMHTSQSSISRWEAGAQLPTLQTMQSVAPAAGLELVIGLKHPHNDDVMALAVVDDEKNVTKLRMLLDYDSTDPLRPTGWRERLVTPPTTLDY